MTIINKGERINIYRHKYSCIYTFEMFKSESPYIKYLTYGPKFHTMAYDVSRIGSSWIPCGSIPSTPKTIELALANKDV